MIVNLIVTLEANFAIREDIGSAYLQASGPHHK
jgi:hypothetical protein